MPFGIGVPELLVVLVVALIFFGPKKLPELGSSLGNAIREFRRATSDMTRDLREGLDDNHRPASANSANPVAPPPEQVICGECATANPKQNKFCAACGKGLMQTLASKAVSDAEQVICAHCSTANPNLTRFCRECGGQLTHNPPLDESKESHITVEQHPN